MAKLYIMCGPPGSGKSHFLKTLEVEKHGGVRVSRDDIRFALLKDGDDYFKYETKVVHDYIKAINDNLIAGKDVYADAVHTTRKSRHKIITACGRFASEVILVWIKVGENVCLRQNEMRTGRAYIQPNIIRKMYYEFQEPEMDELFDKIIVVEDGQVKTLK